MNILQLCLRIPYPTTDGGAIAMYGLASALKEQGHHVTLCALNTTKHYINPKEVPGYDHIVCTDLDTNLSALKALKAFLFSKLPYNIERFYSTTHEQLIAQILKQKTFDIIQLEGVYASLYLPVIRELSSAKVILRAHNVEYRIWARYAQAETNLFKKWYYRHLARSGKHFEEAQLNQFDGIVAITHDDAEQFKKMGFNGKMTAIACGVNTYKIPVRKVQENHHTIGYIGSLDWRPNVQGLEWFLEKIWPGVLKQNPDYQLQIAGKSPPSSLIEMHYPNTKLVGFVVSAQQFMEKHSIIIVPLLSGSGMRIKILEAMAMGRCVVCTPLAAEGIQLKNMEHIVICETEKEYVIALNHLLKNSDEAAEIGERGRQQMQQHYNWEKLTKDLVHFYQSLA